MQLLNYKKGILHVYTTTSNRTMYFAFHQIVVSRFPISGGGVCDGGRRRCSGKTG